MRKTLLIIGVLLVLLSACGPRESTSTPVDVSTIQTTVVQTVFAAATQTAGANVPTDTPTPTDTPRIEDTPTLPIPSSTSVKTLVPLYWEVTWQNLGRSEQDILLNVQTNERITLSGSTYQAPLPSERNDLLINVETYYFIDNMRSMGWLFINGWGAGSNMMVEYYNPTGYFLMVRYTASPSVIVWVSDETTLIPIIPNQGN